MLAGGGGIDNAVFYVEGQREAVLLAPSLSIQGIILLMHLLYMHGISMTMLNLKCNFVGMQRLSF